MPRHRQDWSKRSKTERFKKKYLSRMQASRLLQLDAMNFRRLCILKGVYPRSTAKSKQKESGNQKQYYLTREIKWLVRDQLSDRFAAYKAWQRKVRRAKAMHRFEDIETLQKPEYRPTYNLDATLKERYPFFVDAVRDMDDALSMLALYSFLAPEVKSDTTIEFHHALPTGLQEKARAAMTEWTDFVSQSKSLSRAFISVKGYYYEAYVHGERVLWLMPHEYAHKFPQGVQQYVLISFLEFYCELSKFVLFKLKHDLKKRQEEKARAEEDGLLENAEDFQAGVVDSVVGNKVLASGAAAKTRAEHARSDQAKIEGLFKDFTFYFSRETPVKHLRFVVESCGGRILSEFRADAVTHYIVDRPSLLPPHKKESHIEYLQPQYVWDCLNSRMVLPPKGYRMGEDLPPHVSPFTVAITNSAADQAAFAEVKKDHPKLLGYVPNRVHELRKLADPEYEAEDPDGVVQKLDDDDLGSQDSEVRRAMLHPDDEDDDVSLEDDDIAVAMEREEWEDEQVKEHPERSKLSAFKVQKQRELNLMNKPTDEAMAHRKADKAKSLLNKQAKESKQQRTQRKLKEAMQEKRAKVKMQKQVMRKKDKHYYEMIAGSEAASAKKAKILSEKAKALAKGRAKVAPDGKSYVSRSAENLQERLDSENPKVRERAQYQSAKKKAKNDPYKNLPHWVQ